MLTPLELEWGFLEEKEKERAGCTSSRSSMFLSHSFAKVGLNKEICFLVISFTSEQVGI